MAAAMCNAGVFSIQHKHDLLPSHNRQQNKNVKRRKQGKRKEEIR
jgi:hypothetical protein